MGLLANGWAVFLEIGFKFPPIMVVQYIPVNQCTYNLVTENLL